MTLDWVAGPVAAHQNTATPDEATRRLQVLLDRLPALIGYWDLDLRNVIANAAFNDYLGFTPEEARGRHIREILGPTVYALNLPYIQAVLAGEEQLFERTLIDQHGVTRHMQAAYVPDIVDGRVQGFYSQVTDVTARVEAEHARDEALRLFEISMANAPFGKVVLTTSGRALQVNPAACALLGYTAEELIGKDLRELVQPEDRSVAGTDVARLQDRRYIRRDGTMTWMQRTAVRVPGVDGGDDVIVVQFLDVTARRHAEAELARLAQTDPLTGLHNRHAFTEHIGQYCHANPATPVGVIFIDLDGFKRINDTHGHSIGDAVLVHVGQLLARHIEPPNSAYRMGGDEFVVLCLDAVTDDIQALADALRTALAGSYLTTAEPVTIAATVGWTRGATDDIDALLHAADAAMYCNKPKRRRHND